MDHCRDGASPPSAVERRALPDVPWVSVAEALTFIAFGDAMAQNDLRAQVEGHRPPITDSPEERLRKFFAGENEDVPEVPGLGYFHDRQWGLSRLTKAWHQIRDDVARGDVNVRGRFTPTYSLTDARLADVEELTGNLLATFSQFDVSTGGIRRQPEGSPDIMWQNDPHSFDREFDSFSDDARATGGYLLVEVERMGLLGNVSSTSTARAPSVKGGHPPDDEVILDKADEMKARGMNGRDIAGAIRLEPGFENVGTVQARDLIKGRWKPGGRPKRKRA